MINIPYLIQPTDCPDLLSTKRLGYAFAVSLALLFSHLVVAIVRPFSLSSNSTSSFREDSQNFPFLSPSLLEPLHRFLQLLPIFTIKMIDKDIHTINIIHICRDIMTKIVYRENYNPKFYF